jgi:hypothetical protein
VALPVLTALGLALVMFAYNPPGYARCSNVFSWECWRERMP